MSLAHTMRAILRPGRAVGQPSQLPCATTRVLFWAGLAGRPLPGGCWRWAGGSPLSPPSGVSEPKGPFLAFSGVATRLPGRAGHHLPQGGLLPEPAHPAAPRSALLWARPGVHVQRRDVPCSSRQAPPILGARVGGTKWAVTRGVDRSNPHDPASIRDTCINVCQETCQEYSVIVPNYEQLKCPLT